LSVSFVAEDPIDLPVSSIPTESVIPGIQRNFNRYDPFGLPAFTGRNAAYAGSG
jgi:hypothetical protein